MDGQDTDKSMFNFQNDDEFSFCRLRYTETQKSLKEKFKALNVNSSQASVPVRDTLPENPVSLLSFNFDMESTIGGSKISFPASEREHWNFHTFVEGVKRNTPFKKDDSSSDLSLNIGSGNEKNYKNIKTNGKFESQQIFKGINKRFSSYHREKNHQEPLRYMISTLDKERLKLLKLQRTQVQNEMRIFKTRINIKEMELSILQRSARY